jgi:endonuclease/exonuclease/phosphatase (EEP) superfamily protein YafD
MPGPVHRPTFGFTLHVILEVLSVLALLVPLGLALLVLTGMTNKVVDIVAQFTAPALVVAVVLTGLVASLRLKVGTMVGSATCVALLIAVAPQWWPPGPRADNRAPAVRLYAANLYYLNDDVAAIGRSVAQANADVVVLIELGAGPASRSDDILKDYPHRTVSARMDHTRGASRTLIGSRYPLSDTIDPADGVQAVATTAQTPLGPVTVVGAHLTRPWPFMNPWGQISQAMALQALIRDTAGPVILAGDFNSISSGRVGRQIQRDIGLHPAPGFPGTWPADLPAPLGVTIDQVYASRDLAFVSRRLGRPTGSDHRPVIVEITRAAR